MNTNFNVLLVIKFLTVFSITIALPIENERRPQYYSSQANSIETRYNIPPKLKLYNLNSNTNANSDDDILNKRRLFFMENEKLLNRELENEYPNLSKRELDYLGGDNLLKRNQKMSKRELDYLGGDNLLKRNQKMSKRELDYLGGDNLLKRSQKMSKRELDYLGGSNLLKRNHLNNERVSKRELDYLGGDNLLKRDIDSLGGPNLLKRELDYLGGDNLVKRELDYLGGSNLLKKRELDYLGGDNLIKRELVTLHTRYYDSLQAGAYGEAKRFDTTLIKSFEDSSMLMSKRKNRASLNPLAGNTFGANKRSNNERFSKKEEHQKLQRNENIENIINFLTHLFPLNFVRRYE